MHRFDHKATAQQTRRVASTGGGVIRASAPEGLEGAIRPIAARLRGSQPTHP